MALTAEELSKLGKKERKDGWYYISVSGSPEVRGMVYGYRMAGEILAAVREAKQLIELQTGVDWEFFKTDETSIIHNWLKHLKSDLYKEFYQEMEGMVRGVIINEKECEKYPDFELTVEDLVLWNGYEELTSYWFPTAADRIYAKLPGDHFEVKITQNTYKSFNCGAHDHCSAFIATGSYTERRKIVMAHNSFTPFENGNYENVITDITPEKGNKMIMQSEPGYIHSMSDFYLTGFPDGNGLMITETTIGGFNAYDDSGAPEFVRIRYAAQYAESLDEFVELFWKNNNGGYANTWLVGDTRSGEIMRYEAGLKFYKVDKTSDGYFAGFNAPLDAHIRNFECSNSGFADIRRHQGARQVRIPQLMEQYKGQINDEIAKKILADHYDVYLEKENPCSRTICAHYELDDRKYMSAAGRPGPYQPRGAVDGLVADSEDAEKMRLWCRWGSSCGMPFKAEDFLKMHPQFEYLRPFLKDRPTQNWTTFASQNESDSGCEASAKKEP